MNDLSYHILKILETEGEKDIVDLWTHFDLKIELKAGEENILRVVAILGSANWIHYSQHKTEPVYILPLGRKKYLEERKIRQRAIKKEPNWVIKAVIITLISSMFAIIVYLITHSQSLNQRLQNQSLKTRDTSSLPLQDSLIH